MSASGPPAYSSETERALVDGELQPLWREQVAWQTRVRWAVPPVIAVAAVGATLVGYDFAIGPVLAVAAAILVYNLCFYLLLRNVRPKGRPAAALRRIDFWQVAFDYGAMFLLIAFTGGPASPLLFLFIFHVIFAAILFRPSVAWSLAMVVVVGVCLISAAEYAGWIPHYPIRYGGQTVDLLPQPAQTVLLLAVFAATVLVTAGATAVVMQRLRREIRRGFEAEQALLDERSSFMLRVAHDVRAPLDAASSMLDLLRQGYLGEVSGEQQQYIERVHRRLTSATAIVNDLLVLARGRERAARAQPAPVDVRELLANIEATYRDHAMNGYVGLTMHATGDTPAVLGDASMLEQMLGNLVSNAIKYTPAGGEVHVSASAVADRVRLDVRDNGIGIPDAEQASLFAEFFRASNARRVVCVGTGLGLAIVKQIVEQHGGTVCLESAEGEGTHIIVELPAAPRAAAG